MKIRMSNSGLSLVELMIALLLGSLLMLGLSQIYLANRQSSSIQQSYSRVQEGGRIALQLLSKDIRMADYKGCSNNVGITNHLNPDDSDYASAITGVTGQGVSGHDNVSNYSPEGTTRFAKNGTDTLILRGTNDACSGIGRMVQSTNAASLHSSPECDLEEGEIVVVTNCAGGEMFTITNLQNQSGAQQTVVHNTGANPAAGWVDNATKTFSQSYGAESMILRPYYREYFVSTGVNGDDSLFMVRRNGTLELVTGVTDFQVLYGEAPTAVSPITRYSTAATVGNWDNVKSIQVDVTLSDGSVSRMYSSVVGIRNRLTF